MLHYGNQQQIKRWHPAPSRTRLHSLWAQLDFTQTCLAGKRICLTGGLTEPIFRTATARSEPAAQLAAGGKNLKEQEGEHRRTSEVSLARTADGWLQRPGYEHDRQLRQQSLNSAPIFFFFFLSRLYGPFKSVFIYIFLFLATPGIRFGRASPRWHGNSRRSPLDVDIYGMCIFMSAWWYSTWQPLILAPLIPEKFLRNAAEKSPPGHELFICPHIY